MRFHSEEYQGIAAESGLPPEQLGHWMEGLQRKGTVPLPLDRAQYDALQLRMERLELARLRHRNSIGAHFHYSTRAPLTPLRQTDHPRHCVVDQIFHHRFHSGLSVFGQKGLSEMDPAGKAAFKKRIQSYGTQDELPFSAYENGGPAVNNYLALPSDFGRVAVTFKAPQSGQTLSTEAGELVFGEEAEELLEQVLRIHRANGPSGRMRERILRCLA